MQFDLSTILLNYAALCFLLFLISISIWYKNRKIFNGLDYFAFTSLFQGTAMLLIVLRNHIPDWLSYNLANIISITGHFFYLVFILKFHKLKVNWAVNVLLILAFAIIYGFLRYHEATENMRNTLYSVFFIIFLSQVIFFSVRLIKHKNYHDLRSLLIVNIFLLVVNIARISHEIMNIDKDEKFISSTITEPVFIALFNIIFIAILFEVVFVINSRLIAINNKKDEKYRKIIENGQFGFLLVRLRDSKITETNQYFEKLSKYTSEEAIGKTTIELGIWYNEKEREKYRNDLLKSKNKLNSGEYTFKNKFGELFYCYLSTQLIEIDDELFAITIFEDVTEYKKLIHQLEEQKNELKQINLSKDKLFSVISHDLRSPFVQIKQLTELIKDDFGNQKFDDLLNEINMLNQAAGRAVNLLNNLLEWARIQRCVIKFNPEPTEIIQSVQNSILLYEQSMQSKQITVNLNYDKPYTLNVDRQMFESVVRNLLSNAIKFSYINGKIEINIYQSGDMVNICVKDTGVGIQPSRLENMFSIEKNQSTPGTLNETGTGLGLVLCKEYVELHKGKIWVTSEPKKGSTFCFSLPLVS